MPEWREALSCRTYLFWINPANKWLFPVIVFLLALVIGLIVGRGDKEQPAETKQTLTIWWAQWDPAVGLQELGRDYERETGVQVTVQQIPWSTYQDQVFLNFGNKATDFDLVVGDSQWIGRGATKGLYLDLTDWANANVQLAEINATALRYLGEYPTGSGRLFALPCETAAGGEWHAITSDRTQRVGERVMLELARAVWWDRMPGATSTSPTADA